MSARHAVWAVSSDGIEARFVGRGPALEPDRVLAAIEGERPLARVEQRHGAVCVAARPGSCGEADALWTGEPGLALCVVTADCVPVVMAAERRLAVVHAGWRGIASGVVTAAARRLGGLAAAWIGPAIGACCYEVGQEVAARVEAASAPGVSRPGPRGKPHLDLAAAVEHQLRRAGAHRVERIGPCTRCSPERLWSYRRDGAGSGRNLTFAWLA